jgi:hypothetical protein
LRPNSVNHSKVQPLGKISLLSCNLINGYIKYLRRSYAMKIGAGVERIDKAAIA